MRLKSILIPALAFVLAGLVAWIGARVIVATVESRSVIAVREALLDQGHDWASVLGDGLQIVIEGEAPTEAMRFRAISAAGSMVDASRVIDNMRVKEAAQIVAPAFTVEILRNDSGVSLVGLIPAATDHDWLILRIGQAVSGQSVTDLLQSADYAVPEGWREALEFGVTALSRLPRSKISITAGHVEVTAIAASREEQQRLEADLGRLAPPGLNVDVAINAPRPVVTPFTLRFVIDDQGARFDACAADTEEARARILAAAIAAGAADASTCTVALGVPSQSWGNATARSIAALAELGGGMLTFSDADVALVAAMGTDPDLFERVVGELDNALPDIYALAATLPEMPEATPSGPPEFSVTLTDSGATLRGRVQDQLMNTTVQNFALAAFGIDRVTMGTRILPDGLPQGWSIRVLTAIEALSFVETGSVRVLPDSVVLSGTTGNAEASEAISRLFIEKLGQSAEFTVNVTYDEALDPIAALPTPEECVAQIGRITSSRKITFDPGSAQISSSALSVIDDIAEVLRACAQLQLRIAGYTDSQGSDTGNQRLSQQRAEAVLSALRARRVPVSGFEAIGFGEADPIADNGTEDGREANRRIEFSLIGAEVAAAESPPPEEIWPDAPGPLVPGTGTGGPEQPELRIEARPDDLTEGLEDAAASGD